MKILSLERTQFNDNNLSRLQDNSSNFANQLMNNPFLKGNLIEGVLLSATPTKLEHKLGVTPLGYIVVEKNANATVYSSAKDESFLTLLASASVTINIWVF